MRAKGGDRRGGGRVRVKPKLDHDHGKIHVLLDFQLMSLQQDHAKSCENTKHVRATCGSRPRTVTLFHNWESFHVAASTWIFVAQAPTRVVSLLAKQLNTPKRVPNKTELPLLSGVVQGKPPSSTRNARHSLHASLAPAPGKVKAQFPGTP